MPNRFVLLIVADHPPIQVVIHDSDHYERLRAQLINFQEHETTEPDPSLPVVSLEQMAKTFGIALKAARDAERSRWVLRSTGH